VAVKIVRQPNKIVLLGAPTSAAAMSAGHEGAPSALRSAGLVDRLSSVGYVVNDLGDDPPQLYQPDEESPRARNISGVIRALETLKPRVEQAVKSCALPLILSGDCSVALATVAGARRYFRNVSLVYIDRDADLNTPATTSSGCIDGMVVSHLTGRGAAELVRFWGEPPLVREPDLALFGVDRLDPSEEEVLLHSPLRRYLADEVRRMGAGVAAKTAIERIHGSGYEFVLHLDVDVIADFVATNYPGSGGLTLEEVREALEVFLQQKSLAAIEVTAYNPTKDADGSAAKIIVDLLSGVLEKRLQAMSAEASRTAEVVVAAKPEALAAAATSPEPSAKAEPTLSAVQTGESWSSNSLEGGTAVNPEEPRAANRADESSGTPVESSEAPPAPSPEPHPPGEEPRDAPADSGEHSV
jgi:arginase